MVHFVNTLNKAPFGAMIIINRLCTVYRRNVPSGFNLDTNGWHRNVPTSIADNHADLLAVVSLCPLMHYVYIIHYYSAIDRFVYMIAARGHLDLNLLIRQYQRLYSD